VKKKQNKGCYAVQGHQGLYQTKARMRLSISVNRLMVTNILSRIVSELSQLNVQIFDTAFLTPFLKLPFGGGGGLGTTYDVHLGWAHWKARSGLRISVN